MDFTIKKYSQLLQSIRQAGFSFQCMADFLQNPLPKVFVLRHDVDERPQNALKLARVESEMGIQATYYFRIFKISYDPGIVKRIADLGHEIGYHYEDYSSSNGDLDEAILSFKSNLEMFRRFYPVKTVCMHGSSMSKYDNKELWRHCRLSDFGIIGEPYLSIDYSNIFYMTDTGRCWDGGNYSVRDAVSNAFDLSFHRTSDIIKSLQDGELPDQVILQSHTLWTDAIKEWIWLEVREKVRNNLKIVIVKIPFLQKAAYKLIQYYSK